MLARGCQDARVCTLEPQKLSPEAQRRQSSSHLGHVKDENLITLCKDCRARLSQLIIVGPSAAAVSP